MIQYLSPLHWIKQRDVQRAKRVLQQVESAHKVGGVFTTPDAALIDHTPVHLLLIVDDMMQGRPMHHMLTPFEPEYVGRGFTRTNVRAWRNKITEQVVCWNANKEEVPVWADPRRDTASPLPIRGDLFAVPRHVIYALDRILQNNIQYERTRVPTVSWVHKNYYSHLKNQTHVTEQNQWYREAWIYMAKPDIWNVSGDTWEPLPFFSARNPNKPRHYYFHENPNRRNQSQ